MKHEKQLINKFEHKAHNFISEANRLRDQAKYLEQKAQGLLNEANLIKEHIKGIDSNAMCVVAKKILKASNEKLGGFALQTIHDALDGKSLEPEQLERFRLLAREYLQVVV